MQIPRNRQLHVLSIVALIVVVSALFSLTAFRPNPTSFSSPGAAPSGTSVYLPLVARNYESPMITRLIYVWYLLTMPTDKVFCSLWVSQPPDNAALVSACGNLDHKDLMVWRAVNIQTGAVACERPAAELPALNCNLPSLSQYLIMVVWPHYQEIRCTLSLTDPGTPDEADIERQCPQQAGELASGNLILKFAGTRPQDPQPAPICPMNPPRPGPGVYDLPPGPESLRTSKAYALLAGHLIWYGLVKPHCNGLSGLDPTTHAADPCGVESAMPTQIAWQNQFDQAIYQASIDSQVPPKILKGVIGVESQFWPFAVGQLREISLIQLSQMGADIALRYSPELYAQYCPQAGPDANCQSPYGGLTVSQQVAVQDALRAALTPNESFAEVAQEERRKMPIYASTLRAYYCYAGGITGAPSWDSALAVYQAGAACVSNGQICQAGLDYINQVTK